MIRGVTRPKTQRDGTTAGQTAHTKKNHQKKQCSNRRLSRKVVERIRRLTVTLSARFVARNPVFKARIYEALIYKGDKTGESDWRTRSRFSRPSRAGCEQRLKSGTVHHRSHHREGGALASFTGRKKETGLNYSIDPIRESAESACGFQLRKKRPPKSVPFLSIYAKYYVLVKKYVCIERSRSNCTGFDGTNETCTNTASARFLAPRHVYPAGFPRNC